VFWVCVVIGGGNLASGGGQLFRKLTAFLVAAVPALVALGLLRAVALLRRGTGATWRDAFGAFMIWQSTSLVVARASVQGLFAREAEFLRTPKTAENARWWDAVRGNLPESLLGALGLAGVVAAASARRIGGGGARRRDRRLGHRSLARVADRRVPRRSPEQPGGPACGAAWCARRASPYGVPAVRRRPGDRHGGRAARGRGNGRGRGGPAGSRR